MNRISDCLKQAICIGHSLSFCNDRREVKLKLLLLLCDFEEVCGLVTETLCLSQRRCGRWGWFQIVSISGNSRSREGDHSVVFVARAEKIKEI
jgi:hypothetical protein